ncbi:MAG: hydroxyacylglutathione hydrolase [Gammaproteobacteria bacterium]|nr:hydroxyacylglutathione hydrolase [Gammaproteobacteria bacterium]
MTALTVHQFPCLGDNYGYLIHDEENDLTAAIDTPEASKIEEALKEKGWKLTHILNTHHHFDHAGGNEELKRKWGCVIVGSKSDAARIPGIDEQVGDGDIYTFGNHKAKVLDVSGHTQGHIAYYFEADRILFSGDALFALGCGRLFEGSPEQMWTSLQKLIALPDDTTVYCAHEYTQSNARFALTVEPQNSELQARAKVIDDLRSANKPTVPSNLGVEKRTNPFLRPMSSDLQETLGMTAAPLVEVFAETRLRKDNF